MNILLLISYSLPAILEVFNGPKVLRDAVNLLVDKWKLKGMELWKDDSEDDTHEIEEVKSVENKIKLLKEERYVINYNYKLIIVYIFIVCVQKINKTAK